MFGGGGKGDMVREGIVAHLDSIVGGLDIIGLEGRSSNHTSIGDNTKTPHIDLIGMSTMI